MKLIKKYLMPYKLFVFLAPVFMFLEVMTEVFLPKIMTQIISIGVTNNDSAYITKMFFLMIGLSLLGILGGVGCLVVASLASQKAGTDIRLDLFEKIQAFSFHNIDKFKPSSLITRLTNDITQIQLVILMSLRLLIRSPLLSIGSIIMAVSINAKLSVIFLIMIPLVVIVMIVISKKAFPLFDAVQKKLDNVNVVMRENLSGVRVVKAFVRSDFEIEKFETANANYKGTTIGAYKIMMLMMPSMMMILNFSIILILWFGGVLFQANTLALAEILAFITYVMQILMSLMMFAMVMMMISRAKVSINRITEVLDEDIDIKNPESDKMPEEGKGTLEFLDVTFRYEDDEEDADPVLEHISFTVNAGETVAIIGETGSGKSTLVSLVPRLYDVTDGEILLDGINVKDYNLKELRKRVSMVLQESILFSGTIKDNIKWGKEDATEEEIIDAAKAAQAHDFIMELPEKYDTVLGQKGVNVSGGQKQRISIARALIQKPLILIFDDSTSAVDMGTEKKIQKVMNDKRYFCTKFIIAQRIMSVAHADKILVLNGGKIVAEGNHNYLMSTSEEYQGIYSSQMGRGAVIHE